MPFGTQQFGIDPFFYADFLIGPWGEGIIIAPGVSSFLLLEIGDHILLEIGDSILLEG